MSGAAAAAGRPHRFGGTNALVTGASRGIGAATAERLAAEGANVALVARPPDASAKAPGTLAGTAERLRAYGTTIATVEADLSVPADRQRVVPAAVELLGGDIDVLVNNAAANMAHTLLDFSLERRHRAFKLNFHGPVDLVQAVLPGMVARGRGWIVNVTSQAARHAQGPPFGLTGLPRVLGVYGASKAALDRVTNAFAAELEGTGTRVNAVAPRGAVASEGAMARGMDMIPPDRFEPMEAMVEAVAWLCCCPTERTGQVVASLDLLDEVGATVWRLDATALFSPTPGGATSP